MHIIIAIVSSERITAKVELLQGQSDAPLSERSELEEVLEMLPIECPEREHSGDSEGVVGKPDEL